MNMAQDDVIGQAIEGTGVTNVNFQGVGTAISVMGIIFLLGIVVIMLLIFYLNLRKYKHQIIVKNKTSGVARVQTDKARIYYDANGTEAYWKLLKLKFKIPAPPAAARHQTDKGAYYVACEINPEKGVLFYKNKMLEKIKTKREEDGEETQEGQIEFDTGQKEDLIDTEEKLTGNQKIFYLKELERADKERSGLTKWDVLNKAIMPAFFIIVLLIGLIFLPGVLDSYQGVLQQQESAMGELSSLAGEIDAMRECRGNVDQQEEDPRPRPD